MGKDFFINKLKKKIKKNKIYKFFKKQSNEDLIREKIQYSIDNNTLEYVIAPQYMNNGRINANNCYVDNEQVFCESNRVVESRNANVGMQTNYSNNINIGQKTPTSYMYNLQSSNYYGQNQGVNPNYPRTYQQVFNYESSHNVNQQYQRTQKQYFQQTQQSIQTQQSQYYTRQQYGSIYNPYHKNINPNYY